MASHKVKLLGGALALFVSQLAMAVGLGDIKLHSALNEPLDAEIELLNVGELTDLEMLVGLASRKDFERAGVTREFFLTGLQFTIDLSGPKPKVRVKSQKPVREPYLDFLVEMQWPSGRLLKEYTLLVDLPVYSEDKPQAKSVDTPSSTPSVAERKPESRPSRPVQQPRAELDVGGDYQVERGDTLWGIARRSRPQGASIHQTMVAIHELNPRAFVRGDINLLKRGEVLRLPANHQITASHREAVSEVAAQQPSGALIDAVDTPAAAPEQAVEEPQGRLKLSAALGGEQPAVESDSYSTAESDNAQQDGANGAARELLENELTITQEELARKDRELEEAKQRIAMLEAQQETQRLIDLQSDGAGAAQAMASESAKVEQPVAETVADAESAADKMDVIDSEPAESGAASDEPQQDFWQQYKYYLMAGAGALLLLLIVLGLRRKNEDTDTADDFVFDEEIEPVFAQPEIAAKPETASEPEPSPEPQEVDLEEDDQLFAAEAFDMEEPEEEAEGPAEEESLAVEEVAEQEQEMLPILEESEAEAATDSAEGDDDLDFDIDLELGDDLVVSDDDSDEEDLDLDQLEVVADVTAEEADSDLDLDIDGDEIGTKLDLAKAYSDVGDKDGAREMLEEVVEEGNDEQQREAKKLLEALDD